jgi:hypothetical protein
MKTKKAIKRIRTNVTLPPVLFQKVKDYDLNLSAFLQIKLVEYFTYIEGKVTHPQTMHPYTLITQNQQTQPTKKQQGKSSDLQEECGRRDLNPSFKLGKLK